MANRNTPFIETERLFLREFTEKDIEDIFLIYNDEEVNKFLPWFPMKSIQEAKEYFDNNILPDYAKDIAFRYSICLKNR